MVVWTLKIQTKLGYRRWSESFRHSLDRGCWCLQGSQFFRRLVTHVWFWSGFPTHDRLRASSSFHCGIFTSLAVTHVVPRKDSLAMILEEYLEKGWFTLIKIRTLSFSLLQIFWLLSWWNVHCSCLDSSRV